MTTLPPNQSTSNPYPQEQHGLPMQAPTPAEAELLATIIRHLQTQTGQDFSHYKSSTLWRRVHRRMGATAHKELASYWAYLRQEPTEAPALLREFLIAVTGFFRDAEAFTFLQQTILPQLLRNKTTAESVRVWVVGCATGEEAYSVAMLLSEAMADLPTPLPIKIFATDLDEENLAFARRGLYTAAAIKRVSNERRQRFFIREKAGYRVKAELREKVLFLHHNLLQDPPFADLDLICCRNVLLYFNREAQLRCFELFYTALRNDSAASSYLFLGATESAHQAATLFTLVPQAGNKRHRLYQRRANSSSALRYVLPSSLADRTTNLPLPLVRPATTAVAPTVQEVYQAWTLRRYAPPRLLVNTAYEITHIFNGAGRYLRAPDGRATQNILQKVIPSLSPDLHPALYQAFTTGERTASRLLPVKVAGESCFIQLQVGPVTEADFPKELIEVVIEEHNPTVVNRVADVMALTTSAERAWVTHLEEELQRTQERLHALLTAHEQALQDLHLAREALQAANEELTLTAEELATSKEELQSMNEELVAVNDELREQLDTLNRASHNHPTPA